jgi:serine/threonine protein kinase/WD40 repeat protein
MVEQERSEVGGQWAVVRSQWSVVSDQLAGDVGQKAEDGGRKLADSEIANRKSQIIDRIGDYELLEEIGRGGMGVVYRARQRSLDRAVAIKVMAFGPGASPEFIQRFRAEAVSAASLHHPNIVAIHEVGIQEGQHFFVMDHIEGQSLAEVIANGRLPMADFRLAARWVKTVAEAVHYAHERGILHRDLKPSNILIDAEDQPRLTDFGLAKRFDPTGGQSEFGNRQSEITVTGQVLGSPNYLPPEQASGQLARVSRRTDVYALGATLYHLLTARPPFQAESLAQTLDLVLHTDPVSPRLLNPSVPRDLETICLKCLEKEPSRRYATAQTLADELGRFLANEPIQARQLGPTGKLWRWCRRKPQVASLAGVAMLTFLFGFAGVLWQWRQAVAERRRAESQAYISDINAAQAALKDNNPARVLELLNRHRPSTKSEIRNPKSEMDLRGFEWRYLWQQCRTEAEAVIGMVGGGVRSLEISPDGRWLIASSETGAAKLWNLATGEEIRLLEERGVRTFAAFSPDSRLVLFTDQTLESVGAIAVWDLNARRRVAPIKDLAPVGPMAFSADGQWLGIGLNVSAQARAVRILDFKTRTKQCEQLTATGCMDAIHGFDWGVVPHRPWVVFSENDPDRRLVLWDFSEERAPQHFPAHDEAITALAISPDGQMLATGAGWSEKRIKLWTIPSFKPAGELAGHDAWIAALKFSPDGKTLASSSADQTIRFWNLTTREPIRVFSRLPSVAWRVCFTPDGRKLLSGSSDGCIERWPLEARPAEEEVGYSSLTDKWDFVRVAPDGRQFAAIRQGKVFLAYTRGDEPRSELPALGTNNNCLLFSTDAQVLFAGTETGEVQVWSVGRRALLRRVQCRSEPVRELLQDRTGRILVVCQVERAFIWPPYHVSVWTTENWQQQRATYEVSSIEFAAVVSPDGAWLATGRYGGPVRLRSLSGPPRISELAFAGTIQALAFSADARLLAAATQQGLVKVWELPSGREVQEFRARSQNVFALAFSPDGRRLVTAGEGDGALRLWDVGTWQELITLRRPGVTLDGVGFIRDGNQLTALTPQGELHCWRVPSFEEIEAKEKAERGQ